MCNSVEFLLEGSIHQVTFSDPGAELPLVTKDHGIRLVSWGRRHFETGELPIGGSVPREAIESGDWARWDPVPVKIHVRCYMELDANKRSHWFDVPPLHMLQGLVATHGPEQRVYVVTVPATHEQAAIHDRWPRMIEASPLFRQ